MCITNHFVFPQANDDLQFLALEKQKILEFETYLAAASTKVIYEAECFSERNQFQYHFFDLDEYYRIDEFIVESADHNGSDGCS